jgi:Gnt-I system low-affinity gluconate transporter
METFTLIFTALGSVLLLLFLVMKARLHAFVALMIVSIGAGIFSGMPVDKIADTMQKGMGGTLGFLAVVVALGAMFGKILHETGALDQIAIKLLSQFGQSRAHYALGVAGLICTLPLFFDVAIVLLIGVVFAVARRTGGNVVKLAIPLFAGVAASAAFLIPGPTAMLFWLDDFTGLGRCNPRHDISRTDFWSFHQSPRPFTFACRCHRTHCRERWTKYFPLNWF